MYNYTDLIYRVGVWFMKIKIKYDYLFWHFTQDRIDAAEKDNFFWYGPSFDMKPKSAKEPRRQNHLCFFFFGYQDREIYQCQ